MPAAINPVPTSSSFLFLPPPSPSCLSPFCMCELRPRLPVREGSPILPLFIPAPKSHHSARARDCPSVNGKGILWEIVVGNNKPSCHEAKSIFKALGFSGTTARKSITTFFFFSVAPLCYASKPLRLIVPVLPRCD